MHDNSGPCAFGDDENVKMTLGFLCSKLSNHFLSVLNPTLHYQIGNIASLPIINSTQNFSRRIIETAITFSQSDWNAYETSWDFTNMPLLNPENRQPILKDTYHNLRSDWQATTQEMQRLEEENNCIFIEAYGLQDELTPEVPLKEITLTCNPHYRYGGKKNR
ncbi:MAG: hypothetical protein Q9O24_00250 [Gammaproteobacteria bacterium]|nr:hypothetical protein [Gammaproteobacteria bacterium]